MGRVGGARSDITSSRGDVFFTFWVLDCVYSIVVDSAVLCIYRKYYIFVSVLANELDSSYYRDFV
jgi:hypothetical protein